jgi:hypothetical protein
MLEKEYRSNNVAVIVVENYRLIVVKRFARPNNPDRYAGGSVSTW